MKIEILLANIKELKAQTTFDDGDIKTKVSFETRLAPIGLARLLNLQRQGVAMDAVISSNQGTFDLELTHADADDRQYSEIKKS